MGAPRSIRVRTLVAGLALLWPATAAADLVVPIGDGAVTVDAHRAIIAKTAAAQTLISEMRVRNSARRFVWMRAYPEEPRLFEPVESPFDGLAASTRVRAPYNQLIRDDLFGPSVVTVLVDRLTHDPETRIPKPVEAPPRRLQLSAPNYFTGKVTSSTITYELYLPEALDAYLQRQGVDLDQDDIAALSQPLNRGWTVSVTIVEDNAPTADRPALVGPHGTIFSTAHVLYPQVHRATALDVGMPFEIFMISKLPLVSSTYETVWDVRPWEGITKQLGKVYVDYNAEILQETTASIELTERQGMALLPGTRLMRMTFDRPRGTSEALTFVPARNPVDIPSGTRRGSLFDIFLTILLGLTPLLYTPESWFLLWVASRARARARASRDGSAFGTKLWSFFAVAVGLYWFYVLPDVARIAGVVPVLIGIVQLALPYTGRDQAPVRVQFKKKRKKA